MYSLKVGIPELIAMELTYPEKVFSANIERLRNMVRNGIDVYPGANYIIDRVDGSKTYVFTTAIPHTHYLNSWYRVLQ